MQAAATRPTAPFTVFHRSATGEGGYRCQTCGSFRADTFPQQTDAFAVALQHLSICRSLLRHRPVEGVAILDGKAHGVVLRDGFMLMTLDTVFATGSNAVRLIA